MSIVAAAASALAIAPSGFAKTESWAAHPLKCPATWERVFPNAIDRKGRIVGGHDAFAPSYTYRAVLWPGASSDPVELPLPPGGQNSWAIANNDRGQVAGNVDNHAVLWDRKGAITDLHARLTGFDVSSGISINRRGDVAGIGITTASGTSRAIFWPRRGAAVVLPMDDSVYLQTNVWAMNDRGTVGGNALLLPSGRPNHAVYWPRGDAMVDLHAKVREAMPTAEGSAAMRVLSDGRIVGQAWEPFVGSTSTLIKSWVYDPRTGAARMIDGGGAGIASAWGSAGSAMLVGFLDGDPDINRSGLGATRPALWQQRKVRGGTTWQLTELPVPAGYVGLTLSTCNVKGVIIAWAIAQDGTLDPMYVTRSRR